MGKATTGTGPLTIKRVAGWLEDLGCEVMRDRKAPAGAVLAVLDAGSGGRWGILCALLETGGPQLLELRVPFLAQAQKADNGDETSKAVAKLDEGLMCLNFKLPLVTFCRDEDDGEVCLKVGRLLDDPMSRDGLRGLLAIVRAALGISRPMIDAWREAMVEPADDTPKKETPSQT